MVLKKVAVIGYPVKHSLSPKLHGYWINQYKDELKSKGIEAEYGMLEVAPEDLEKTLLGLKDNGYVGCNLTVPHKERAFEIVGKYGSVDEVAKLIGAVNTIYIRDGKLFGTNTDAYGFIENIKQSVPEFDFKNKKAVVLGAGGAARAVSFGLIDAGIEEVFFTNRTFAKSKEIKQHFNNLNVIGVNSWEDRSKLEDANLLVNTTSLGMMGEPDLDINLDKLPLDALVTDIVYKPCIVNEDYPLETTLLKNARNRGNKVVDGLGMLLYQAQGGFELWFGIKPEVTDDLRNYILS